MARDRPNESSAAMSPAQATYQRYASALSRYLVRRVHRPEDVADLTQEIFELFVRRKERSEVIRDPLAYLFRIAFHVVGAALADRERNPVTFDSQRLSEDAASETCGSSDEEAEALVAEQHVRAALAKLPANHLTALLLVEGQGMSYKEAARASGFSPSTIATYVMHARAGLKLALDNHCNEKAQSKGELRK